VPILVFLGLSVLDLGPMYMTDRRQTKASLNAPAYLGWGHNSWSPMLYMPVINGALGISLHTQSNTVYYIACLQKSMQLLSSG